MGEITVTVPIYWQVTKKKKVLVAMNWLRNAHFMVSNNVKRGYLSVVKAQVTPSTKMFRKCHIHYTIYLKRKGTDGGNVRSVIEKFVLDALVKCKVIEDDTFDIVVSDSSEYHLDRNNPRAEITIKEITGP